MEPEQLALIEGESEEALLLPKEVCAKQYTAALAEKFEQLREAVVMLLGCGYPVEKIAARLRMSTRTVDTIGARHAVAVAGDAKSMAAVYDDLSMTAAYYLKKKIHEAKPGDLNVTMGVAADKSRDLKMMQGAATDLNAGALEVESESPELAQVRERIKQIEARRALKPADALERIPTPDAQERIPTPDALERIHTPDALERIPTTET
jgi:hypothetical protein